jgi:Ca2+-binding RTX toxin-like protein
MVTYIRSDLDFILAQIKIAESHSAYIANPTSNPLLPIGQPLYGPGGSVPAYNVAWGLRTVDGRYNHLLPGQENWGASDTPFPELVPSVYRTIMVDPDGPGGMGPIPVSYTPGVDNDGPGPSPPSAGPGDVFDPYVRQISNLLVDQTLNNPAAILVALERAGFEGDSLAKMAEIQAAFEPLKPLYNALGAAERAYANALAAANASPNNPELQQAAADALAAVTAAQAALDGDPATPVLEALLADNGIELEGANVKITNVAPDEGLSAPFNSWFTLFGQFFDHGLDLVNKGGSGTVFIPLLPDDPLFDPESDTNFMVLTRATLDANGATMNTTTSYVDQNQTYTSHPSHQVFLRQYVMGPDGPVATGKLIEGANGGMANWAEVKEQARVMLGIQLTDQDVGSVPLLRTDPYGNFIPGDNGFPQVVYGIGDDGIPNTADDVVFEGNPAANANEGISLVGSIRTNMAFLADIAHTAVPNGLADGDIEIGLDNLDGPQDGVYDDELLDAHFIAGDGRANENIGLTAVHHVFHAEHNRLVEHTKTTVLATGDLAFINEWLAVDIAAIPADTSTLVWDGERLFQAAKFGTEMQYQHLVFEEFARKVQPNINVFLVPDGFDTTMDPSIVAEFAHVVYRFGHSMLTESIDSFDPAFQDQSISLIQGFLNPTAFNGINSETLDEVAAGAIVRGMTRQVGNDIDEFVTSALRNNLLGLPLDLATINLARGRDTGVPTLNAARASFYEATTQDIMLKPYDSWVDFAANLKHEASIINFIAAYGTHALITGQSTTIGKRDAALTLITGTAFGDIVITDPNFEQDRSDFLNASGIYAGGSLGGLNNVDLWIGGLAERTMPFGGMLGSTFNFVFEVQMEKLQSGDRFYYLQRLDGLHLFGEMENNSFAAMIMRNTDATHLPSDVFSTPGLILEVDRTRQYVDTDGDGILENNVDPAGGGLLSPHVQRNNPGTVGPDTNYLRYSGDEHVVMGGTEGNDIITASIGDDTIYGDGGNDRLEGGFGNDIINAGAGDDIITDNGGDDNIKAGDGNDVVHAGGGLDLVMGGRGNDFIFLGTDMGSEVFAGEGNDFIYGNKNAERILGNEGNDWIETGTFDGAPGDNFDEIFARDSVNGHDVFLGDGGFDEFIAEGGDDIMVGSPGRGKMAGMSGWDWATYKDNTFGVDANLTRAIVFDENPNPPVNATLDGYEAVEGLSGSRFNDLLTGSNILAEERVPFTTPGGLGSEGYAGSRMTKESLQLIIGLDAVMGLTAAQVAAMTAGQIVFSAGDIILGGRGSDTIMGMAGDDIIDGDKYLDVNIAVYALADVNHTGPVQALHKSMTTLATAMFNGTIKASQLSVLREIKSDNAVGDIDIAKFQGGRGEYAFSATADGQVIVTHAVEDSLDGTDRLRNIEKAQFATGNALNIIVGTAAGETLTGTAEDDLILGLDGADTINAGAGDDILVGGPGLSVSGQYRDEFNSGNFNNSNGTTSWTATPWAETNDSGGVQSGQIRIDDGNNVLRFYGGAGQNGAEITRVVNLAAASTVTITYDYDADNLDGAEQVRVMFAADGVNYTLLNTIDANDNGSGNHVLTGVFSSTARIRFETSAISATDENVEVDNLNIAFSAVETLNGGAGNDTYSVTAGDGNDVINELANEGAADRISILAPNQLDGGGLPVINPDTGLPVPFMSSLNAADDNTGTQTGSLVITYGFQTGPLQTITVNNHFNGAGAANAQVGVERIGFNGSTVWGYLLGTDDYFVSRLDPADRAGGDLNLSTSTQQNFLVGENGINDEITGGTANDLIFGGSGDNDLFGGLGDDLLVGGNGNGDDDLLDGGADADTMVGLNGNDTYVVDDLLDVVVEAAGANTGTDTVQTLMAELSIENMANVENLEYTGIDADPFVGTGNAGNNEITGGDLNDTLSGLAGNDTLDGGLGADIMRGGADNDVYVVDDAGDVVDEVALGSSGIDRVESDISYVLGAGVENLDLNNDAPNGTGNELANIINGNDAANNLQGAAGADTLNGDDGNDFLDGGSGNDTISGGDDTDTIIGGAGDDTIDVGGGVNTIVYNAAGFGNDTINSFDNAGGTPANQDRIDLSGLGLVAADYGTRVVETTIGGAANTLLTVLAADLTTVLGSIRINNSNNAAIDATDITWAVAGTNLPGATTGNNTLNGTAGNDIINALAGNDTLNGNNGDDTLIGGLNGTGGPGADIVNGGAGNDTVIWNANLSGATDGRDIVDGGTETGPGDTYVINGNASGETYNIYTRQAWDDIAGNNAGSLNGATEIVITRNGSNFASVIGELREIEEIRINGVDPSGATGGAGAGDTFNVFGDFSGTNLRLNTVTINGSSGRDTVNISGLLSEHRVVFNANGGNDRVIGDVRVQDIINGVDADDAAVPLMRLGEPAFMSRAPQWKTMEHAELDQGRHHPFDSDYWF